MTRLMFHYALPVGVFAYCYGRIFHVIRRQSKVVTGPARMATTSRDQVQQQQQQTTGAGATAEAKLSRTELNVIKTMIAVIVCFIACWSVFSIANLLVLLKVSIATPRPSELDSRGSWYRPVRYNTVSLNIATALFPLLSK